MKPIEKAKELFQKYCYAIRTEENDSGYFTNVIYAKDCAIIAVDEIINSYPHSYEIEKEKTKNNEDITIITNIKSNIGYWLEVKEEIEKL